jgi:beta-glucosidase
MRSKDTMSVSVEVTNTGHVAGDEVAQLYVHDVSPSVKRPIKELQGYQRINLKPGEHRTVTFSLPAEKLAFWDEKTHGWVVEPEKIDVMVGSSSGDIRVKDHVEVVR